MEAMDLEKFCRTCLSSCETLCPLFDDKVEILESDFHIPAKILNNFISDPVEKKPDFPNHICFTCFNEIQRVYLFKLKCEKSQKTLNQLKIAKVSLKQLKEIPKHNEFEGESNCQLTSVKDEIVDMEDFFQEFISEIELEDQQISENLEKESAAVIQMNYKSEPELHIEDIDYCDKIDEQLNCLACEKECPTLNIFIGHIIIDHLEGSLCKICNEEFDCSQLEHLVKHLPLDYLDDAVRPVNTQNTERNCRYCSLKFTDLKILCLHVITEHSKPEFKCPMCSIISVNRIDYKKHMKEHNQNVECEICTKILNSKFHLTQHMRIHTGEKPFQCKLCSEKFRIADLLKSHMEKKHLLDGKPRNQCKYCLKIFSCKNDLAKHVPIHTGEKPFECTLCSEKFRLRVTFRSHMDRIHANELPGVKPRYRCKVCSKIFGSGSKLNIHMLTHTGEKPHNCKLCPKKFQSGQSLQAHMDMKHANELNDWKPKYQCKECSKFFGTNQQLTFHIRNHTGEKPFGCELCSKKFRHGKTLKGHMISKHIDETSGDTPKHQCKECLKIFACERNLITHTRLHTGEKPFQCKFCSEKFRHKHLMQLHMDKKHIKQLPNEKPKFQCKVCSKIFSSNYYLVTHLRIHTGEKPFKCEICRYSFRYKLELSRHEQLKHTDNSQTQDKTD